MRRFLIADTHFGHRNIIEYAHRPFRDIDHMDKTLIRNWNQTVRKEDLVYVLGDFTLSRRMEIISDLLEQLNGRKILIMGNHDTRRARDYVACGFEVATRKPMMVEPGVILMHKPFEDPSLTCPRYIYFFGHVHDKKCPMDEIPNCRCVSVERIDYRPIDLDQAISAIRKSFEFYSNQTQKLLED